MRKIIFWLCATVLSTGALAQVNQPAPTKSSMSSEYFDLYERASEAVFNLRDLAHAESVTPVQCAELRVAVFENADDTKAFVEKHRTLINTTRDGEVRDLGFGGMQVFSALVTASAAVNDLCLRYDPKTAELKGEIAQLKLDVADLLVDKVSR